MVMEAVSINDTPEQALAKINQHDNAGGVGVPVKAEGIADEAVSTAKLAPAAVTQEKLAAESVSVEKLTPALADIVSQSGAGGANAPGYYERDAAFSAIGKTVLTTPARMWINIAKKGFILETANAIDISQDVAWDTNAQLWEAKKAYKLNDVVYPSMTKTGYYYRCTTAGTSSALTSTFPTTIGGTYNDGDATWICEYDYTVAANRKGADFYIYSCVPELGTTPTIVVSANSTEALHYTSDTSRKTGGFHCLCMDAGTNISDNGNVHPLSGYVTGDILPASVWDLIHRPKSSPEGMAYHDGLDLWVDIYLTSWTGTFGTDSASDTMQLVSKFGRVTADGVSSEKWHALKFDQQFSRQKKRLLWRREFMAASIGSNQATAIKGAADVNTTGGHVDTANRRMISNIGLEDCCGFLDQWGQDVGSTGASGWGNDFDANDHYVKGDAYNASSVRVLLGGDWDDSSHCGSRYAVWSNGCLALHANFGARGASEPLGR